jgi:hypothetical protein
MRVRWFGFLRFFPFVGGRLGAVDRSRGQGGAARSEARTNDLDAGEDRRMLAWLDEREEKVQVAVISASVDGCGGPEDGVCAPAPCLI